SIAPLCAARAKRDFRIASRPKTAMQRRAREMRMNATAGSTTDQEGGSTMQGVVLMAVAMLMLPCMDAIAKYMATFAGMSPGQVTFYRFFFQVVCTIPLIFTAQGSAMLRPKRPWLNLLRGAIHG